MALSVFPDVGENQMRAAKHGPPLLVGLSLLRGDETTIIDNHSGGAGVGVVIVLVLVELSLLLC